MSDRSPTSILPEKTENDNKDEEWQNLQKIYSKTDSNNSNNNSATTESALTLPVPTPPSMTVSTYYVVSIIF